MSWLFPKFAEIPKISEKIEMQEKKFLDDISEDLAELNKIVDQVEEFYHILTTMEYAGTRETNLGLGQMHREIIHEILDQFEKINSELKAIKNIESKVEYVDKVGHFRKNNPKLESKFLQLEEANKMQIEKLRDFEKNLEYFYNMLDTLKQITANWDDAVQMKRQALDYDERIRNRISLTRKQLKNLDALANADFKLLVSVFEEVKYFQDNNLFSADGKVIDTHLFEKNYDEYFFKSLVDKFTEKASWETYNSGEVTDGTKSHKYKHYVFGVHHSGWDDHDYEYIYNTESKTKVFEASVRGYAGWGGASAKGLVYNIKELRKLIKLLKQDKIIK